MTDSSTVTASTSDWTAELIFNSCGYHYIEVPVEPRVLLGPLPESPVLHKSEFCADNDAYIVAGFGVVAGKMAHSRLVGQSYIKWVGA